MQDIVSVKLLSVNWTIYCKYVTYSCNFQLYEKLTYTLFFVLSNHLNLVL